MSGSIRYTNPELQDLLASKYALGNMNARVRERFERLMEEHPELNKKVCAWEERLHPIYAKLPTEKPQQKVWDAIDARLKPQAKHISFWNNLLFFKTFSGLALAMIVGLSVFLQQQSNIKPVEPISRGASYVAVMLDNNGNPNMVINTYRKPLQLSINLLNELTLSNDKQYHLWAITKETREVHALGKVSLDNYSIRPLSRPEWSFLKYSRELFITEESLEFQGLLPSGKALYQGTCSVYKPKRKEK